MSFLHEPGNVEGADETDGAAAAEVAALYDADRARMGHVANYTRTFAARPAVYAAWQQLNAAIKASMPLRTYELATVAAARDLRSSYCALAHGEVLAEHIGESTVRDLIADPASAGLEPADEAVVTFAGKVAAGAADITADDVDLLRANGFADAEILDVVLAAAARCFFSSVLDATGTRPDAAIAADLEPQTRRVLTVGRPIDELPG